MLLFFLLTITIQGNKNVSDNIILKILGSPPIKRERVDSLLTLYRDRGFLKTTIRVEDTIIFIDEGERFRIGTINITGNREISTDKILLSFKTRKGGEFNKKSFESDINWLLNSYENKGYPFTRVEPVGFNLENNRINLGLRITEGVRVRIDNIRIEGNDKTASYVIRREMGIKKGDWYNAEKIEQGKKRVERLGFLRVREIKLKVAPERIGEGKIVIKIEEIKNSTFQGVLGYKKGDFTGLLDLQTRNLFGTGRFFKGYFASPCPKNTRLELLYREPWLFGLPVALSPWFKYELQDTLFAVSTMELSLIASPFASVKLELGMGLEKVIPGEESYYGTSGMEFDTRDDPVMPMDGEYFHISAEHGVQIIRKIYGGVDKFLPVSKRSLFFLSFNGGLLPGDSIPDYEKLRLGGAKTVRGYEEDRFRGKETAWTNLEYRFLLGGGSYVLGFYDVGYIKDVNEKRQFLRGIGAGFGGSSKIGLWNINYGLGKGDRIRDGKIHIRLINRI